MFWQRGTYLSGLGRSFAAFRLPFEFIEHSCGPEFLVGGGIARNFENQTETPVSGAESGAQPDSRAERFRRLCHLAFLRQHDAYVVGCKRNIRLARDSAAESGQRLIEAAFTHELHALRVEIIRLA